MLNLLCKYTCVMLLKWKEFSSTFVSPHVMDWSKLISHFQISFLTSQLSMYSNFLSNHGSQTPSPSCFPLICWMMPVFGGAELVFFEFWGDPPLLVFPKYLSFWMVWVIGARWNILLGSSILHLEGRSITHLARKPPCGCSHRQIQSSCCNGQRTSSSESRIDDKKCFLELQTSFMGFHCLVFKWWTLKSKTSSYYILFFLDIGRKRCLTLFRNKAIEIHKRHWRHVWRPHR